MIPASRRQRDLFETPAPSLALTPPQRAQALALLGALLSEALRQNADVATREETRHDQDHA